MESLLIAVVALLILLPILHFLPLGFTLKGKVFVAVAAFLIGVFGLLASSVFALWQTALVLLFVVAGSAYLLDKRGSKMLYRQDEEGWITGEEKQSVESAKQNKESNDSYSYIASSDKAVKRNGTESLSENNNIKKQNPVENSLMEKLMPQNDQDISIFNNEHTGVQDELEEIGSQDLTTYSIPEQKVETGRQNPLDVSNSFDIEVEALLNDAVESLEEQKKKEDKKEKQDHYLSEIEKILEEDGKPESVQLEEKIPPLSINDDFELEELVFDDLSTEDESIQKKESSSTESDK